MTVESGSQESGNMVLFDAKSESRYVAVGVVLASLFVVGEMFPVSIFIGTTGGMANITLSIAIAPLFGILLGPGRGSLFGLAAGVLRAMIVGGLSLIVPTIILGPAISGFLTGLCARYAFRSKGGSFYGPVLCGVYLLVITTLYMIPNLAYWWFMSPYILAAVVAGCLLIPGFSVPGPAHPQQEGLARFRGNRRLSGVILALALVGTITEFSMMTMGAVYLLHIPGEVFGYGIFPLMLVERTFSALASTTLALTVLAVFPDLGA